MRDARSSSRPRGANLEKAALWPRPRRAERDHLRAKPKRFGGDSSSPRTIVLETLRTGATRPASFQKPPLLLTITPWPRDDSSPPGAILERAGLFVFVGGEYKRS
eukprot:7658145-Pyramimonas_sp.AAC.1